MLVTSEVYFNIHQASIWMDETLDQSLQLLNLTDTQLFEDEPEEVKNKITFDLKCAAYRWLMSLKLYKN